MVTVIVAEPPEIADELAAAVMLAVPAPTAVTGTPTVVEPAPIVTLDGTVAADGLLFERVMVVVVGCAAERFSTKLADVPADTFSELGENASAAVACAD